MNTVKILLTWDQWEDIHESLTDRIPDAGTSGEAAGHAYDVWTILKQEAILPEQQAAERAEALEEPLEDNDPGGPWAGGFAENH